jgi:opacity protein-like surface antigen
MLGIGTMAQAQFRQSIYLNGNIPTGNFGSSASAGPDLNSLVTPPSTLFPTSGVPLTTEQIGKDASIGFGLGYRVSYRFDVGLGMVAPFANVDFLWNTLASKWSEKYSDAYMSSPTYFNIPLMGGVTYIYDELPWDFISVYGEFGIGTDFLWITSEGKSDYKFAYKSTFSFAWMLGAGAFFGEHVSAGLYYYNMGTHNIDYTQGTLDDNAAASAQVTANEAAGMGRQRRSVGSVMLRIGFHF